MYFIHTSDFIIVYASFILDYLQIQHTITATTQLLMLSLLYIYEAAFIPPAEILQHKQNLNEY
jgi:hypothetical protein